MQTIPECLIQAKTIEKVKDKIIVRDIVCIITCSPESKESSLKYLKSKHQVLDLNNTKNIVILHGLNKKDRVLTYVKNHNKKIKMDVTINILEVASELADLETRIELCDNENLEEGDGDWEKVYVSNPEGINYTEEAQKIFNAQYEYFYNFLLEHSKK